MIDDFITALFVIGLSLLVWAVGHPGRGQKK